MIVKLVLKRLLDVTFFTQVTKRLSYDTKPIKVNIFSHLGSSYLFHDIDSNLKKKINSYQSVKFPFKWIIVC